MEENTKSSLKFVYCLDLRGSRKIYRTKDEAIVALLSHFDRLCYSVDTYDLDKQRYVEVEELVDLVDEDYLDRVLVQNPHLTGAVAEVKECWAESTERDKLDGFTATIKSQMLF